MANEVNAAVLQLREVFSDENFVKELVALETPEEVQARLKEKNVDLSMEQIEMLREKLGKQQDGELSEDDLEEVAGGLVEEVLNCITAVVNLITEISSRRW